MFYLCCALCAKHYPTNIDVYSDGGINSLSIVVTFNDDSHMAERIRLQRIPPDYDIWYSTDFEKCYSTYTGAKKGLLYYHHQSDHDNYKYDNKQFQKILTIVNEHDKEITLSYILKKAYHAYQHSKLNDGNNNFTCEIIQID